MAKKQFWKAFTSEPRHVMIEKIKNAILYSEGSIINFNMFSDLGLSLSIECPEESVPELYTDLSKLIEVEDYNPTELNLKNSKDMMIYFNITFGQGKGDLVNNVPEV